VGQDDPAVGAVDDAAGVVGAQPGGGGHGQQVGAVRGWDRPDVVQAGRGQVGEVGDRVLAGVEHHRHPVAVIPAARQHTTGAGGPLPRGGHRRVSLRAPMGCAAGGGTAG